MADGRENPDRRIDAREFTEPGSRLRADGKLAMHDPKRIAAVEQLMEKQYTNIRIVEAIVREFGVSRRTAYNDIHRALSVNKAAVNSFKTEARTRMRMSLQRLYRKAYDAEDWRACIAILAQICKLDGLNMPEVIVSSNTNVNTTTTFAELRSDQRAEAIALMADQVGITHTQASSLFLAQPPSTMDTTEEKGEADDEDGVIDVESE